MITRRQLLGVTLAGAAGGMVPGRAFGQGEQPMQLEPIEIDATAVGTPIPADDLELYMGDPEDLWYKPWLVGNQALDIGFTIVQRFEAPEGMGFALGHDGVVARSVIYGVNRLNAYIAFNSDLSALEGAKTFSVIATYGGVQFTPAFGIDEPILIAHDFVVPE